MRILAIDTATEACSVALAIDDHCCERWVEAPREHGERLFAMIDEVLAEAGCRPSDLDAITYGRGPGAFTGVRIATGAVQGMALGLDLPVLPVSTLQALAQGAWRTHGARRVLAAIDARMGEVYWGPCEIEDGVALAAAAETVCPPEAVPLPEGRGWQGWGTGWSAHGATLAGRLGDRLVADLGHALPRALDLLPAARRLHAAGGAVAADRALPVYVRDRVVRAP